MECQETIRHTIRRRDTLFQMAYDYKTTEERIMAMNPGIDPMNLRVGQILTICPNTANRVPPRPGIEETRNGFFTSPRVELMNTFRRLWEEHIMYTRMVVMSVVDELRGDQEVTARLLENPGQMGEVFGRYFGREAAGRIARLFTEHLVLGKQWATLVKQGDETAAAEVNRKWIQNADDIAAALSALSPQFNREMLQQMMYTHLDTVRAEAESRLAENYPADIKAYDFGQDVALEMADYFTRGIIRQFPSAFR